MIKTLPIIIALCFAIAGLTAYHKVTMWRADKRQEAAVAAMQSLMKTKQNKAQKEYEAYEAKIDVLDDDLNRVSRMYERKTNVRSDCTAASPIEASGDRESSGSDEGFIAQIFGYSARAEERRIRLLDCQKFIREIQDAK